MASGWTGTPTWCGSSDRPLVDSTFCSGSWCRLTRKAGEFRGAVRLCAPPARRIARSTCLDSAWRTCARSGLWKLRNSILAADYDDRAHDSAIWLQRYWQRSRHKHVTDLIAGEGPVLDVGCGSSRIIGALPRGSVAMDILLRKLRYARKFGRPVVQASGFQCRCATSLFRVCSARRSSSTCRRSRRFWTSCAECLKPGGRLVTGDAGLRELAVGMDGEGLRVCGAGGYADEHIAHYTYDELCGNFTAAGSLSRNPGTSCKAS